jgi:hypothetical protein
MTGCETITTRIVQETIASLFQQVSAPSNTPPSFSFGTHPTPSSSMMVDSDLSTSLPFTLAEPLASIPLRKTGANAGAAATLRASLTAASLSQTLLPTRSITLAGGAHIIFMENDVPRPPSVSFARDLKKDIVTLNGMWDDYTEHWAGISFLNIQGHPIPIAYWKAVYSAKQGNGWKPGEWKLLKSNYFDWKVSVFIYILFCFLKCFFIKYIDSGHTLARRNA